MFQRILVPLDGSERAEQALSIAARLARASGGTLLLLRVDTTQEDLAWYATEAALVMPDTVEAERAGILRYLERMAASDTLEGVTTKIVIIEGAAAQGILDTANEQQADVIVIGSHGRTGFKRWMIGSVAQKVARQSPVPVLILRTTDETQALLPQTEDQPVQVMVPLDGSTLAEAALKPAVALSQALSSPVAGALHLVQVLPIAAHGAIADEIALMPVPGGGLQVRPPLSSVSQGSNPEILAASKMQALSKVHAYLSSVESTLRKEEGLAQDFHITTSAVMNVDIASAVMELAESGEASGMQMNGPVEGSAMIAMATHGRSGLTHWIMGSITERVLGATRLPLLIVRSHEH